jgi:hypothetical protein
MILVMKSSSIICRAWERNGFDVEEFDGTLREYVIKDMRIEEEYIDKFMSGADQERTGFGIYPGGSEEDGYEYEGEEISISYSIFNPSQKFVDMLQKYVKK